jgi:hypothetical protein
MLQNFRRFEVGPDPVGRAWIVEFRWLQNAISIRHADAIDVKFQLISGEHAEEKVIALPHPDVLALSRKRSRPVTDAWCMKLAALHIRDMILTDKDMEKVLVTVTPDDLERYAEILDRPAPVRR